MNDKLKDQALESCINIYEKLDKLDLWNCSLPTLEAWKVGECACSLINKKVEHEQAKDCEECKYTYTHRLCKLTHDGCNYTPVGKLNF